MAATNISMKQIAGKEDKLVKVLQFLLVPNMKLTKAAALVNPLPRKCSFYAEAAQRMRQQTKSVDGTGYQWNLPSS